MTAVESIKAIKELLSDPKRWTKERYARDSFGNSVDVSSPSACCWCLAGACIKIGDGLAYAYIYKAINSQGTHQSVTYYNDNGFRTHQEILEMLDLAIEKAKKMEKGIL
jgi:hypothetical protein